MAAAQPPHPAIPYFAQATRDCHSMKETTSGLPHATFGPQLHPPKISLQNATGLAPHSVYNNSAYPHPSTIVNRHYNPSTNEVQQGDLQQMLERLQDHNIAQANEIVELKIRVAVLERELERASKDKDSVTNSLSVVIGALTSNHFSGDHTQLHGSGDDGSLNIRGRWQRALVPNIECADSRITTLKELEREVELLRQKKKYLSEELKERDEVRLRQRKRANSISSTEGYLPLLAEHQYENASAVPHISSPVRKKTQLLAGSEPLPIHLRAVMRVCSTPPAISKFPTFSSSNFAQGTRDGIQSTPIPKATLRSQDSGLSDSSKNPNTVPENEKFPSFDPDVGFKTIDELFAEDTDNEEVQTKNERQAYFSPLPPSVLKVGFENSGAFAGKDTEFERRRGAYREGKWGGLRPDTYLRNHFTPPTLQQQTSSQLTNHSSVELEAISQIPKDKSFGKNPWDSAEEREIAIKIHRQRCGLERLFFPDIFKYGLQYRPTKDEKNTLRTIIISNLPRDIVLRDVLSRVRGGEVLMATLCDTFALIGSMSVRIVFKREYSASAFVEYCLENPITFFGDLEDLPCTACVNIVSTPTYPYQQHRTAEQTRCLVVENLPEPFSIHGLEIDLACNNAFRAESLLDIWLDENRNLNLEFSSLSAAGNALAMLINWRDYRRLRTRYAADPCAGLLDELVEEPKLSRLVFQKAVLKVDAGENVRDETASHSQRRCDERAAQREVGRSRGGNVNQPFGYRSKEFVPLADQKVGIPSISGRKFKDYSWTGEMNGEIDSSPFEIEASTGHASSPKQPTKYNTTIRAESVTNFINKGFTSFYGSDFTLRSREQSFLSDSSLGGINQLMTDKDHKIWKDRKPRTGLAGSKYATHIPGFEDRDISLTSRVPGLKSAGETNEEDRGYEVTDGIKSEHDMRFARNQMGEPQSARTAEGDHLYATAIPHTSSNLLNADKKSHQTDPDLFASFLHHSRPASMIPKTPKTPTIPPVVLISQTPTSYPPSPFTPKNKYAKLYNDSISEFPSGPSNHQNNTETPQTVISRRPVTVPKLTSLNLSTQQALKPKAPKAQLTDAVNLDSESRTYENMVKNLDEIDLDLDEDDGEDGDGESIASYYFPSSSFYSSGGGLGSDFEMQLPG